VGAFFELDFPDAEGEGEVDADGEVAFADRCPSPSAWARRPAGALEADLCVVSADACFAAPPPGEAAPSARLDSEPLPEPQPCAAIAAIAIAAIAKRLIRMRLCGRLSSGIAEPI
jgi:hypothetical protein